MKMPALIMKRKFALTVFCALIASIIAFTTGASLNDWTFFTTFVIGTFGAADVADKKLNGGKYDERETGSPASQPGQTGS